MTSKLSGVNVAIKDSVCVIEIDRPTRRNAVDAATAESLAKAFRDAENDEGVRVIILTGSDGHFCAGADLRAIQEGHGNRLSPEGDAPMGPSRMFLRSQLSPPSREPRWREDWSSRSSATFEWPHRAPPSASSVVAGASR